MYILENDSNFPRESIVPEGTLTLEYLGGFKELDALGARQKISMEVGATGIYLTYPLSQGLLGKNRGNKVFIPTDAIEYINVEQDRQVREQQGQKNMAKRAAVGAMVGGRRGARIGALTALGSNTTTTTETLTFRYSLKFQGNEGVVQCAMGISVEGNQGKMIETFNQSALKSLLHEKLVKDGNFSALNATTASSSTAQPTKVQSEDPYEEIVKLKGLLDQGILTEEEFNKKKKELLGLWFKRIKQRVDSIGCFFLWKW